MKPTPAEALPKLGLQLIVNHAAALAETYRGSELTVLGSLMLVCAEDAADGGRRTRDEIVALRDLLSNAAAELTGDAEELKAQIQHSFKEAEALMQTEDTAALQTQLLHLRQALIAYHEWVEQNLGADSPQNKAIWTLLAKHHTASRIQSFRIMAQMQATME